MKPLSKSFLSYYYSLLVVRKEVLMGLLSVRAKPEHSVVSTSDLNMRKTFKSGLHILKKT